LHCATHILPPGPTPWSESDHHAKVYALAFSPTGGVLASGGADRKLRLTEVASLQQVRECEGAGEVRAVAVSAIRGLVQDGDYPLRGPCR